MGALGRFLLLGLLLALGLVAMSLAWEHHALVPEEAARARHLEAGREFVPRSVERTGTLPDVLGESSGVAVSRSHPGVLWTHNDAGGSARLFAVTPAGRLLAVFAVEGAVARDWEDVALGACPGGPDGGTGSCIYVADTGDNERGRSSYALFLVPEPDPRRVGDGTATVAGRKVAIEYPDGPHDVEALAVGPEGDLLLLTKGRNGRIQVFRIGAAALARGLEEGVTVTVERAGTLAIRPHGAVGRMVTGAALSPSGRRLVVRTYTELYFYRRDPDGGLVRDGDPCFLGELEPQGEAVDFLDEETVIVTSEASWGREGTIHRIRCR